MSLLEELVAQREVTGDDWCMMLTTAQVDEIVASLLEAQELQAKLDHMASVLLEQAGQIDRLVADLDSWENNISVP